MPFRCNNQSERVRASPHNPQPVTFDALTVTRTLPATAADVTE
jgi:hypothetical protein